MQLCFEVLNDVVADVDGFFVWLKVRDLPKEEFVGFDTFW